MKIILTGSTGFLGSIIRSILSQHEIVTLGRTRTTILCDLSKQVPKLQVSDLIIHSAGKAHVFPNTPELKQEFFNVNLNGTLNLLKGLENANFLPKSFVFISSVSVYGLECGFNIKEDQILNSKDAYGLSKIQAEQIVLDWCHNNNVTCTILRLPLLVGANPPGNLGAMVKAIKKGYYFNIGGGKARKSMVLAEDVAQFILKVAPFGGTYNLTDGVHPTFKALSQAIAKKNFINLPLSIAKVFGFLGDFLGEKAPFNSLKIKKITSDLTFDDSKARAKGWKPKSVLDYLKFNDL